MKDTCVSSYRWVILLSIVPIIISTEMMWGGGGGGGFLLLLSPVLPKISMGWME